MDFFFFFFKPDSVKSAIPSPLRAALGMLLLYVVMSFFLGLQTNGFESHATVFLLGKKICTF